MPFKYRTFAVFIIVIAGVSDFVTEIGDVDEFVKLIEDVGGVDNFIKIV